MVQMGNGELAQAKSLNFQVAKTNLPSFKERRSEETSQSAKTVNKIQSKKTTSYQIYNRKFFHKTNHSHYTPTN